MAGREHPEKPAYTGGAFKVLADGKLQRLKWSGDPFPPEVVSFLTCRFREDEAAWQRLIDAAMMYDRPDDWLTDLHDLAEAYYPEGGAGGGILFRS